MTYGEEFLIREMAQRACTTHVRDRIQQSILLRSAKNEYEKIRIRRIIMDARARWRTRQQLWQREWGSKVSRRPQRGNHHDSWATREAYVRCHGDYSDYIGFSKKFWK